jgi:selenocysteine lyase/cysteine desulfurase
MVAGAALLQGATKYHIVRASDGYHNVPKHPARLAETYVDIRAFSMTDWAARPQLASAMVQANQQQLLGDSAATTLQEKAKQLLPDWPKK